MPPRRKEDDASDDTPELDTPEEEAEKPISPKTHIFLEGLGYVEHPEANDKPRRLLIDGKNYEHVSEEASGVWCYRRM